MRKAFFFLAALLAAGSTAQAQLPFLRARPPIQPELTGIDAQRAAFSTAAGSDTVMFGIGSAILAAPAKATLVAQAQWLRQHPEIVIRVEGYGDTGDTRDHALAIGARRASEVRDYLILLGVPAVQLGMTSLGKERPGAPRAVTVLVR
jgi:peptidoglycan-associated lipoprotein